MFSVTIERGMADLRKPKSTFVNGKKKAARRPLCELI
jgi:hypothetical protein